MRKRDDVIPARMPDEIIERLQTKGYPPTAVAIRKAEGAAMPLTTRGLLDLAARLRAEREVYEENAKLDAARGESVDIDELSSRVAELERQKRDLEHTVAQQTKEIERQTGKTAMAVSSGGSQR